jgi:hypothetical protein
MPDDEGYCEKIALINGRDEAVAQLIAALPDTLVENTRLREENARLRRIVKIAYAEGCYDISKTEKTQEEFEALWRRTFSYKIISGRGKDEAP